MANLKFVTLFPFTSNVELAKDVGMIPWIMQNNYGYKSKLVTIKNGEYPYLATVTKNLELEFIDGNYDRAINSSKYEYLLLKEYIKNNFKNIDILNIYHLSIYHLLLCNYYKHFNKSGICYIKSDFSFDPKKVWKHWWQRLILRILAKNIDIISSESLISCNEIGRFLNKEIINIPNGYLQKKDYDFTKKENIFLNVGRLGSPEKNTELIVRAFTKIHTKCNWNLYLVGPMTEKFKDYIKEIYKMNSDLKSRIYVTGNIENKNKLMTYYEKSKVFIMPSKHENFSLAVVEAQSAGNFLILSNNVKPHDDFTNYGKYGIVIPSDDDNRLAAAMIKCTKMNFTYSLYKNYADENFNWLKICGKINQNILKKLREDDLQKG
jgi:Glycosyltransferase